MNNSIDLQKLADDLDFDLEDVEMLIEVFVETATESLTVLKTAIENDDYEQIFNTAHSIKGSAANLTLSNISEVAKKLETMVRAEEKNDYFEVYLELSQLINNIQCI